MNAKKGVTVTLKNGLECDHPNANVFDTDDHNNLLLLDNSTDSGLVAQYAEGTWLCCVSHGTDIPEVE